ncbi:hypothetical protein HSB1_42890 [Halogranum salarium B-1]|uniref:Uncharacterized protein n=1 Tax=Halogranum salarium B-1 TaxID=1210908 RepID=J3JDA9_9EURY|nr:hypothetical protein HSB1_42890 [Halogranum salarium B-1]
MPSNNLHQHVERLRADTPRRFTLLQQYHPILKTALDTTTKSYPTSTQLYQTLDDPPLSAHTFGRLLPLLVKCEIIELYTERSNSNRYDLREYSPQRFERLGEMLTEIGE